MKQSRKYLLALGSLLLIVSTIGLGIQQLTKPPALTSNLQYMIVDWAEGYRSIEAMAQAPEVDVIARGVIKDVEYDGFNYNTESKFLFKPHWVLKGLSTPGQCGFTKLEESPRWERRMYHSITLSHRWGMF